MRIVIDHVRGTRRGQREEHVLDFQQGREGGRITIGRHPDCDISFDLRRDIEASTRHAELRIEKDKLVLCDIGSSNGTYIDGERVGCRFLTIAEPTPVTFGAGGPVLRIWWTSGGNQDVLPPPPPQRSSLNRFGLRMAMVVTILLLLGWLAIGW